MGFINDKLSGYLGRFKSAAQSYKGYIASPIAEPSMQQKNQPGPMSATVGKTGVVAVSKAKSMDTEGGKAMVRGKWHNEAKDDGTRHPNRLDSSGGMDGPTAHIAEGKGGKR